MTFETIVYSKINIMETFCIYIERFWNHKKSIVKCVVARWLEKMLCRCSAPYKFLLLKFSSFFCWFCCLLCVLCLSWTLLTSLKSTSNTKKKFFFTSQIYFPGCKPCLHTCDQVGSLLACPEICQSGCSCKEKTFWNPRAMRCLEADACQGGHIRCFLIYPFHLMLHNLLLLITRSIILDDFAVLARHTYYNANKYWLILL